MFELPHNRAEAISVLSAGLGSLSHAIKLVSNAGLPGVTQLGSAAVPRVGAAPRTVPGTSPKIGPIGPLVLVVTAAEVLREAQKRNQEKQLLAVVARFNFNRDEAADMLAAEAYLWIQFYGPWIFLRLPNERGALDQVGQALMNYERRHPTTLRRSERGDPQAVSAVRQIVDDALRANNLAATDNAVYRTSAVDSKLSADSTRCRSLLGLMSLDWRAHHIIPFAVVASLPPAVQLAFVKAGWVLDSVPNLIALPANIVIYNQFGGNAGPVHNSAHYRYSADVAVMLAPLATSALTLPPMQLLMQLHSIEAHFRTLLLNTLSGYHIVLP